MQAPPSGLIRSCRQQACRKQKMAAIWRSSRSSVFDEFHAWKQAPQTAMRTYGQFWTYDNYVYDKVSLASGIYVQNSTEQSVRIVLYLF